MIPLIRSKDLDEPSLVEDLEVIFPPFRFCSWIRCLSRFRRASRSEQSISRVPAPILKDATAFPGSPKAAKPIARHDRRPGENLSELWYSRPGRGKHTFPRVPRREAGGRPFGGSRRSARSGGQDRGLVDSFSRRERRWSSGQYEPYGEWGGGVL